MGPPSLPKALLILLAASVWAAAEPTPTGPRRSAAEEACTPGSTGLLVDLGVRTPPDGLGETLEAPAETPGDATARFQHIRPAADGDQAACRRRFAEFTISCPDCPASVAPPGEVTLDVARQMFASGNKGLGGLVMSLGALTRVGDVDGMRTRVAGLFDGTGALRPDALAAALAAPLDATGAVTLGAISVAGRAAPLADANAVSEFRPTALGDPRLSLVTTPVPEVVPPARSWWAGTTEAIRNKYANYREAPGRALQADFNESWLGYQADRAVGAVERAFGIDGKLLPVLPAGGVTPGLRVRDSQRSWGTDHMVNTLRAAGADLASRGMAVQVNDVSKPQGGPWYRPHRSHQRGVDADLPIVAPAGSRANALVLAAIAKSARANGAGLQYIFSDRAYIPLYRAQLTYLVASGLVTAEDAQLASRALHHEDGHGGHFHVRTQR